MKYLFCLLIISLTSCADWDRSHEIYTSNKNTLTQIQNLTGYNKVSVVKQPELPFNLSKNIQTETVPKWMHDQVNLNVKNLPLRLILKDLFKGLNINYALGITPDLNVSINKFKGSKQEALNLLERITSYGFTINNNELIVSKFVSKTFDIPLPVGTRSALANAGNDDKSQGVTLTQTDSDVFLEIGEGIRSILVDPISDEITGSFNVVKSLAYVHVKTSPSKMQLVDAYVSNFVKNLSKQVLLNIKIIEFRSNKDRESGIDWEAVYRFSSGSLSFFSPGTSIVSNIADYGLAFSGNGKWDGTSLLIKALNDQGSVATETPISALVMNNQANHITQERVIEILEETSSTASEGVVSNSVTRGKRAEGVNIMVIPNVQQDYVFLQISGEFTKIESLNKTQVGDIELTLPTMRKATINFANKLRYGQTIVIASISRSSKLSKSTTFLGIDNIGIQGSTEHLTETLVLLTPRRSL